MVRYQWIVTASAAGLAAFVAAGTSTAQSAGAGNVEGAAVAALVTEVRALRADLAAAAQRTARMQLLLGRVQMQEQRIAYLDRQRAEASAKVLEATSAVRMIQNQMGNCSTMGDQEARRQCELQRKMVDQQLAEIRRREQELRNQESDLLNAVRTEQARWSDWNARLDELEQSLR